MGTPRQGPHLPHGELIQVSFSYRYRPLVEHFLYYCGRVGGLVPHQHPGRT